MRFAVKFRSDYDHNKKKGNRFSRTYYLNETKQRSKISPRFLGGNEIPLVKDGIHTTVRSGKKMWETVQSTKDLIQETNTDDAFRRRKGKVIQKMKDIRTCENEVTGYTLNI